MHRRMVHGQTIIDVDYRPDTTSGCYIDLHPEQPDDPTVDEVQERESMRFVPGRVKSGTHRYTNYILFFDFEEIEPDDLASRALRVHIQNSSDDSQFKIGLFSGRDNFFRHGAPANFYSEWELTTELPPGVSEKYKWILFQKEGHIAKGKKINKLSRPQTIMEECRKIAINIWENDKTITIKQMHERPEIREDCGDRYPSLKRFREWMRPCNPNPKRGRRKGT